MGYNVKKDIKSFFYAIDKRLKFRGSCKTDEDLPTQDVQVGDTYYIISEDTYAICIEKLDKDSIEWTKPCLYDEEEMNLLVKITDLCSLMCYWLR